MSVAPTGDLETAFLVAFLCGDKFDLKSYLRIVYGISLSDRLVRWWGGWLEPRG